MSRISRENYSASNWNDKLTDTIIDVEELGWSSCSLGRCWLIVKVGILPLRSIKKVQVREFSNWGGGREEFRLVELSRWNVESEWSKWECARYLYPDCHVSLLNWARANRIIRRAIREQVSWLCATGFVVKTSFGFVLE